MEQKDRDRVIEFYAMPISEQMPMFFLEEDDSPVFNTEPLSDYDKLVIYLKKVSYYMNLVLENRNLDKLVKNIMYAHYEDDCSATEAKDSNDMYALTAACYYSQKDFSNKKQYGNTICPIIVKMKSNKDK